MYFDKPSLTLFLRLKNKYIKKIPTVLRFEANLKKDSFGQKCV